MNQLDLAPILDVHLYAVLSGSVFPDMFYTFSPEHDLGEQAHWSDFTRMMWRSFSSSCPSVYELGRLNKGQMEQSECAKTLAFILGMVSHQMTDVPWHGIGFSDDFGFIQQVNYADFGADYFNLENPSHNFADFVGDAVLAVLVRNELDSALKMASKSSSSMRWFFPQKMIRESWLSLARRRGDVNLEKGALAVSALHYLEGSVALGLYVKAINLACKSDTSSALLLKEAGSFSPWVVTGGLDFKFGGLQDLVSHVVRAWVDVIGGKLSAEEGSDPLQASCVESTTVRSKMRNNGSSIKKETSGVRRRLEKRTQVEKEQTENWCVFQDSWLSDRLHLWNKLRTHSEEESKDIEDDFVFEIEFDEADSAISGLEFNKVVTLDSASLHSSSRRKLSIDLKILDDVSLKKSEKEKANQSKSSEQVTVVRVKSVLKGTAGLHDDRVSSPSSIVITRNSDNLLSTQMQSEEGSAAGRMNDHKRSDREEISSKNSSLSEDDKSKNKNSSSFSDDDDFDFDALSEHISSKKLQLASDEASLAALDRLKRKQRLKLHAHSSSHETSSLPAQQQLLQQEPTDSPSRILERLKKSISFPSSADENNNNEFSIDDLADAQSSPAVLLTATDAQGRRFIGEGMAGVSKVITSTNAQSSSTQQQFHQQKDFSNSASVVRTCLGSRYAIVSHSTAARSFVDITVMSTSSSSSGSQRREGDVLVSIESEETGDAFGSALECLDMNNDGIDDLIISAPFSIGSEATVDPSYRVDDGVAFAFDSRKGAVCWQQEKRGRVWILDGSKVAALVKSVEINGGDAMVVRPSEVAANSIMNENAGVLDGAGQGSQWGEFLLNIGDVDGDGHADLLISSSWGCHSSWGYHWRVDRRGCAAILLSASSRHRTLLSSTIPAIKTGEGFGMHFSVMTMTDLAELGDNDKHVVLVASLPFSKRWQDPNDPDEDSRRHAKDVFMVSSPAIELLVLPGHSFFSAKGLSSFFLGHEGQIQEGSTLIATTNDGASVRDNVFSDNFSVDPATLSSAFVAVPANGEHNDKKDNPLAAISGDVIRFVSRPPNIDRYFDSCRLHPDNIHSLKSNEKNNKQTSHDNEHPSFIASSPNAPNSSPSVVHFRLDHQSSLMGWSSMASAALDSRYLYLSAPGLPFIPPPLCDSQEGDEDENKKSKRSFTAEMKRRIKGTTEVLIQQQPSDQLWTHEKHESGPFVLSTLDKVARKFDQSLSVSSASKNRFKKGSVLGEIFGNLPQYPTPTGGIFVADILTTLQRCLNPIPQKDATKDFVDEDKSVNLLALKKSKGRAKMKKFGHATHPVEQSPKKNSRLPQQTSMSNGNADGNKRGIAWGGRGFCQLEMARMTRLVNAVKEDKKEKKQLHLLAREIERKTFLARNSVEAAEILAEEKDKLTLKKTTSKASVKIAQKDPNLLPSSAPAILTPPDLSHLGYSHSLSVSSSFDNASFNSTTNPFYQQCVQHFSSVPGGLDLIMPGKYDILAVSEPLWRGGKGQIAVRVICFTKKGEIVLPEVNTVKNNPHHAAGIVYLSGDESGTGLGRGGLSVRVSSGAANGDRWKVEGVASRPLVGIGLEGGANIFKIERM
eukprot:GDKJ01006513.1.p1 GENE.GDKJ01006513.1~~GDKJ01006513.1.p1  ORF type:complete len:1640 (+),score=483.95 GDKJ01006513.1:154-4920(+)